MAYVYVVPPGVPVGVTPLGAVGVESAATFIPFTCPSQLNHAVDPGRSEERRVGKEWRCTRWTGDWSSDVCSSDLGVPRVSRKRSTSGSVASLPVGNNGICICRTARSSRWGYATRGGRRRERRNLYSVHLPVPIEPCSRSGKIGRASCRERVEMYEVDG